MKSSARTGARQLAIQSLYEWQLSQNPIKEIVETALLHKVGKNIDINFYKELVENTAKNVEKIDSQLQKAVKRSLTEIDVVELAVVRSAAYELMYKPEIPYKVIINEAVESAKKFGADQGHKFVNGILDKLADTIRATERNS